MLHLLPGNKMDRRDFITMASAAALTGCANGKAWTLSAPSRSGKEGRVSSRAVRFHVFSKMFQPPVTKSPEALCELFAAAGCDGVQWTVRKGGHATPGNAATELPRLVKVADSFGLKCESICTDITADSIGSPGISPGAEDVIKAAADCGIRMFRPAYFFYDLKKETFRQSMDRIRGGFAKLARAAERSGVKATYQNHSSWGPSVFGGLVWDVYECIRDLDPQHIGLEYDPMHAYFETNLSWSHGFELVAPWISSIDLKDFHYRPDPKNAKRTKKAMVAAGDGIVPWEEVARLAAVNRVDPLYILHFEYDFDKTDLLKTVKTELSAFKSALA
jgi:sugar phosphate isomerase/epimerase